VTKDNIPNPNPKVDYLGSVFKEGFVISGLCDNVAHVQFVRLRVLKTHVGMSLSLSGTTFGRAFRAFSRCIDRVGGT